MDDELKRHMEAMEGRLMARINDALLRLVDVRADLRDVRREMTTHIERRVEKLEGL
jgi:hypothetical protein